MSVGILLKARLAPTLNKRQKRIMKIETFSIKGPVLFTPRKYGDERGFFAETFKARDFEKATGEAAAFVQDNLSVSLDNGTVRGLHYQAPPYAQGKLVSCQRGRILDVIVDIRKSSKTYGQHLSIELSAETRGQLWVPPSFLHGYVTREPNCEVVYKVTNYYAPDSEGSILWNDSDLDINWDVKSPVISKRDQAGLAFSTFESPFS